MGRMPFVYAQSTQYSPWLKLRIGSMTIVDMKNQAYISESLAGQPVKYQSGSFFKGLARPWLGLHAIDIVRRDAAAQRIPFETKYTPGSKFAQVEIIYEGLRIIYNIDLETDVIDEITFSTDQEDKGNLKFSYIQNVNEIIHGEFVAPERPNIRGASEDSSGLLWLIQLVEGSLG